MSVGHYENFQGRPGFLHPLPRRLRRPVHAVYAFARHADDLADEGDAPAAERLAALNALKEELGRIGAGQEPQTALMRSLNNEAVAPFSLPLQPFYDLLSAFMQDVEKTRYQNFAELADYCRRSANPVGRIMLHLYGESDSRSVAQSDGICTALQLINFWQDVAADWQKGRVYIPQDDIAKYKVSEEDALAHPSYRAQARELESIEAALKVAERSRYPVVGLKAEANTQDSAVYLTMSADVFNKATAPGIELQRHQAAAAQAKLAQIYDSLVQRAEVAALQMREDQSRIEISEAQAKALEQVVVDYEDQFKIATRTLLDVVNAYSELASVKQLRVQAQADLMQAKLEYLSATGNLGQWAKIPDVSDENAKAEGRKKGEASPDAKEQKGKKQGKGEPPPPLTLTSVDGNGAPEMSEEDYGEAYTGPEKVFVRVSDSGELVLESEGHPLENIKSESRSVAKTRTTGKNSAARKTAAGKTRKK